MKIKFLVSLFLLLPLNVSSENKLELISDCDRLALHPYAEGHKGSTIRGVKWNDLNANNAINKCLEANQAFPDDGIILTNLSRAYNKKGDYTSALKYISEAMQTDYGFAYFLMSLYYFHGDGVEKNKEKQQEFLVKAAEKGSAEAYRTFANNIHNNKQSTLDDLVKADKYAQEAIKLGNTLAFWDWALAVEKYINRMMKVCHMPWQVLYDNYLVANNGLLKVEELERFYLSEKDMENLRKDRKRIGKKESVAAYQADIYELYEKDVLNAFSQNLQSTVEKFKNDSKIYDDPVLHCILGNIYENGYGVKQNDLEAFKWTKKAAEKGLADMQYNLGYYFEKGIGTNKNEQQAMDWYSLSAKQGYRRAELKLNPDKKTEKEKLTEQAISDMMERLEPRVKQIRWPDDE